MHVAEQLLAQTGLGQPALAEREPASPAREHADDHSRQRDQAGPEPQRLLADDTVVDGLAREARHGHLAGAPQQTHHHAGDQASPLPARRRRNSGQPDAIGPV